LPEKEDKKEVYLPAKKKFRKKKKQQRQGKDSTNLAETICHW
jgi:hypothetical protein